MALEGSREGYMYVTSQQGGVSEVRHGHSLAGQVIPKYFIVYFETAVMSKAVTL
jgi:hypothetical protein